VNAALSTWRATPSHAGDWFGDDELDRSRRYQRPLRRMRLLRGAFGIAMLVGFLALRVGHRLPDALGVDGWIGRLAVVIVALQLLSLLYDVPLDWWVDLVHDHEWGVSTQTRRGFVIDNAKSVALTTVLGVGVAVPLYAVIRATDAWWLWGWLLVSGLSIALGFLFPIVLAPIFNKFTPLEAGDLSSRIDAIATKAGVRITGTYVVDESRRSTRDNAYVAGLGATRRVVLFDTLLEHPVATVEQVVAHEIGHWRLRHLRRQLPLTVVALLVVFVAARLVTNVFDVDVRNPADLPVLLLLAQAGGAVAALATSFVSRAFERQADLQALELLGQPDALIDMHRRVHVKNLADLEPGPLQRVLRSHPPAAERMAFARAWTPTSGVTGG
jgi:STE24 endopeptidase